MSRGIYDNWERVVRATLKREQYYELCHAESRSPSISSISSDFSSFDNHSLISSIMADQPSPNPSTFRPSAYEPLLRIRDLLADGRNLPQSHSTCIGVEDTTRNHHLLKNPNPNLKGFKIYKFKLFLFSSKGRKSSQSSTNQKKPEEELLQRSTDLSYSAQGSKPTKDITPLNVSNADPRNHLLDKVELPPKAAGLNRGRGRHYNSSFPSETQECRSYYDSGDIFPEPKQSVSIHREIENRLKMRRIDQPSKDLATLRQILEALELKGLLHSRKSLEINQISNRNLVYNESERAKTEELQEGRSLLERCDKLLHSVAEMTATDAQPRPVSVLNSSFYRDDSLTPSPVTTKRNIHFKDLQNTVEPPKAAGMNGGSSSRSFTFSSPWITDSRKSFPDSRDIINPVSKQSLSIYDEIERLKMLRVHKPSNDLAELREILDALQSRKSSAKNHQVYARYKSTVNVTRPFILPTPVICSVENYYGVSRKYQIARENSQSLSPKREWNVWKPSGRSWTESNASATQTEGC